MTFTSQDQRDEASGVSSLFGASLQQAVHQLVVLARLPQTFIPVIPMMDILGDQSPTRICTPVADTPDG